MPKKCRRCETADILNPFGYCADCARHLPYWPTLEPIEAAVISAYARIATAIDARHLPTEQGFLFSEREGA